MRIRIEVEIRKPEGKSHAGAGQEELIEVRSRAGVEVDRSDDRGSSGGTPCAGSARLNRPAYAGGRGDVAQASAMVTPGRSGSSIQRVPRTRPRNLRWPGSTANKPGRPFQER